jgi:hypothetical protein
MSSNIKKLGDTCIRWYDIKNGFCNTLPGGTKTHKVFFGQSQWKKSLSFQERDLG